MSIPRTRNNNGGYSVSWCLNILTPNISCPVFMISQHLHLLERISPVIEADARNADIAGNAVLSRIDPANETVLRTLLYFCYHHWATAENLLQSPAALRKVPQFPCCDEI